MKSLFTSIALLFSFTLSAKNVILFVADGMGSAAITLTRHEKRISGDGPLFLDSLPHTALIKTSSHDDIVTDSAASATAMSTGFKTNKGHIGVDPDGKILETILEKAKEMGKSVGVVTTTSITDATPAAFYAHNISRQNKIDIGKQLLTSSIDLAMGGGAKEFLNMRFRISNGFKYFQKFEKLSGINTKKQILALFSQKQFDWAKNRAQPTLSKMADFAIRHLSKNPNGFFLLIEGGLIDYAAHQNLAPELVSEVLDYDDAIKTAVAIIEIKPELRDNTLLIAVSDHETAGLSINGYGHIDFSPLKNDKLQFTGVPYKMVSFTTGPNSNYPTKIATHSATDVPAYGYGYNSNKIKGTMENSDLFQIMLDSLK